MIAHVEALLRHDPHGYIGEIGIDERFANLVPLDVQLSIAGRLLDLADRTSRPVAIHHVGSITLLENLLEGADVGIPIIVHGFLGSLETARHLSNRGCTISIGPNVWAHQTKLGNRLAEIDIPFVLETDYPHVPDLLAQSLGYEQILASHYREVAQRLHLQQTDLEEKMHGLATILTDW
jgi:TatD DNase family protein